MVQSRKLGRPIHAWCNPYWAVQGRRWYVLSENLHWRKARDESKLSQHATCDLLTVCRQLLSQCANDPLVLKQLQSNQALLFQWKVVGFAC